MRHIVMTAVSFTVVFAGRAAGQSAPRPGPDSIPRDLAEALLWQTIGSYPGTSDFTVGKIPAQLQPFLYVPSNARVLGGVSTPSTTIAVLVTPTPMSQVASDYRREMLKLGWTSPPPGGRSWGFTPAPGATSSGNGLEFCHIGQSIELQTVPFGGGTQVTARVQNYGGRCANPSNVAFVGTPGTTPLPTLFNPYGVAMNATPCTRLPFSGGNATSERVQTSLTPAQLVDDFARQLADSGWKPSNAATVASRMWTRPDTGGAIRQLNIGVLSLPNGCLDVSMSLRILPAVR
jgi:hypothetical protein